VTTISSPAYGIDGFKIDKWADYFIADNGIHNDYDGSALKLTRINAGNLARYSVGQIKVSGFMLEVTVNHDLVVPTGVGTFYTWACYDPTLNVTDGSGVADPAGPVRLGISTGLPAATGGKRYCLIDKIVRSTSGQTLTATTVYRLAPWIGPSLTIPDMPPTSSGGVFSPNDLQWTTSTTGNDIFPLGSTLTVLSTGERFYRALDGGESFWQAEGVQYSETLPLADYFAPFDTTPSFYTTGGSQVHLTGTIKRVSGVKINSTGDAILLTTVRSPYRSRAVRRRVCDAVAVGGQHVQVSIKVDPNGQISMYDTGSVNISWLSLDGIDYGIR
jgi:hypothetical protein